MFSNILLVFVVIIAVYLFWDEYNNWIEVYAVKSEDTAEAKFRREYLEKQGIKCKIKMKTLSDKKTTHVLVRRGDEKKASNVLTWLLKEG